MAAYHPPPSGAELKWARLLAAMREADKKSPGYLLGGGHGVPLEDVHYTQKLDCSSSTCKVLYDAGLYSGRYAEVSGQLAHDYGHPGKGTYFTVYANDEHVWIRLHKSIYWRFDTSPYSHSDNRAGPRLRFWPRPTWGFTARHWPGM